MLEFIIAHMALNCDMLNHMAFILSSATLLDSRTLKETGVTDAPKHGSRLMFKVFGRSAKVTITRIIPDDLPLETCERGERKKREGDKREEWDRENIIRSLRRTYQTVMERCKCASVDRMLTLTFKENITDLQEANKAFKEFVRLAKKRFGSFEYVAVPERQKRGAIHYHVGLNKFYDWAAILSCWRLAIKKSGVSQEVGGIFINKNSCTGSVNKMSRYIAKYILKGMKNVEQSGTCSNLDSLFSKNAKRYYASKGIEKPIKLKVYTGMPHDHWFIDRIVYFVINKLSCEKISQKISEFSFKNWMFQDSKIMEFDLFHAH